MRRSRLSISAVSVVRLFILLTVLAWTLAQTALVVEAHHMAPVDYNVTTGNLNEEMVHNGFNVGMMPDMPEIGGGNMNRAELPWIP